MQNFFTQLLKRAFGIQTVTNALKNPSFNQGHYEPKGEGATVLPNGWEMGCISWETGCVGRMAHLNRYTPAGKETYGEYDKFGPRKSDNENLKPEVLEIAAVQPYLDPRRTEPPDNAVTGFKLYGTICYWLYQVVKTVPGQTARFNARAHAWSRLGGDPPGGKDTAKWSTGVGYGAFKAPEMAAGLNDGQRNYLFKCGIDPYGGRDPFASSVVWGPGSHIYNVFDSVGQAEVVAKADQITVFMMASCKYGMLNSNTYWSRPVLALEDAITPPPAVDPPVNYVVVASVLPQNTVWAEAELVAQDMVAKKGTMVFSYDDAKRLVKPGLPGSKVILYGPIERHPTGILPWLAPCVVEVKPFPKDDGTLPPPVSTRVPYKVPNNKGGVHKVNAGGVTGWTEMYQRCADAGRPVGLFKVVRDGGPCMEVKKISPKTYTVWRWFAGRDHEDDTPPSNWQWPIADTVRMAKEWMATLYPLWEMDRAWVDFFEFMNEPDPADVAAMEHAVAFVQACMEDADSHGFKTAIWSWTAGLPRTPTLPSDDPGSKIPQMEMILPTLKWAAEHGHVYAVHDGAISAERRTFEQAVVDKTALRYRYTKSMMDARGWPMPYVVITECYQESGYKKPLWDSWKFYLTELVKDDYVLGSGWFTLGSWEFSPGEDVNIIGQLPKFTEVMLSVPIITPPIEPPTNIKFQWPCSHRPAIVSHPYGEERPEFTHEGIDILAVEGDIVRAGMDGVVYSITNSGTYGLHVVIQSGSGRWLHTYAHMSQVIAGLTSGLPIKAKDVIGRVGNTGNSTGAHLHVTLQDTTSNIRLRGIALVGCVDPAPYLVYPLLVGLHDAGGMEWMKQNGKKGVALIHTALGTEPTMIDVTQYAAAGITVIGRLNYGYADGTGTLPPPGDLLAFENAAIQTMKQSRGVVYWHYGNEVNNPSEWPKGFSLTPDYYIASYNRVWRSIGKNILMGPSPIDPYYGPGSNNRDWWTAILSGIVDADVLFLHSKTQTNDPAEVFSGAKFGDDPLTWQYLHFRTIETGLEVVPTRFKKLPVFVCEVNPQRISDTKMGWVRRNLDWIRKSREYVVMLNNIIPQPISGLVYYRWSDDDWALQDQPDMLQAVFE